MNGKRFGKTSPTSTPRKLVLVWAGLLAAMCAGVLLSNLVPNDRILRHVRFSASKSNFVLSQFAPQEWSDYWDECTAATVGLGNNAAQLPLVRRSFLSPVIGNCEGLQKYLDGNTGEGWDYWRFWHGYQIITRPLLYAGTLYELHYLSVILFVLSAAFFAGQVSCFNTSCAWAFLVAFFCVPVFPQLPFITDSLLWIIAFSIGGYLLLNRSPGLERRDGLYLCFLISGMLTSFLGFFTVPLVTLTVPLLGLYWRGQFSDDAAKLTVRSIVVLSAIWLAGYSTCWATKWVLAGMAGEHGVLGQLSNVIQHRIGVGGGPLADDGKPLSVSAMRSILVNARVCWYGWLIVAAVAIARMRTLLATVKSRNLPRPSDLAVPLLLLAMPLGWLAVMQQHSIWHAWYVARIYFTSFALLLAALLSRKRTLEPELKSHAIEQVFATTSK